MNGASDVLYDKHTDYVDEKDIQAFAKILEEVDHSVPFDKFTPCSVTSPIESNISSNAEFSDDLFDSARSHDGEDVVFKDKEMIQNWSLLTPIRRLRGKYKEPAKPPKRNILSDEDIKDSEDEFRKTHNEFTNSKSYKLFRWPFLILVFGWITILCILYAIVRSYVALSEYYFYWTGKRRLLRENLRSSKNYEEWKANAIALDKFLNLERWSRNPKFSFYDYRTLSKTKDSLRYLRQNGLERELMSLLEACLKSNFAGIENRQLYSHRYYGTKDLIEEYLVEVNLCIDVIIQTKKIDFETKKRFFKLVSKNYGKTALCLSGGAGLAYAHFGVIKALLENDALPKILSGTSGGALVAALACTRTDEELKKVLVPQLAHKIRACDESWRTWIKRWWRTGAMVDSVDWARKASYFTKGSTTFLEASKATGRILNVSTVSSDANSPTILCNRVSSPNCIIWSSLLASAAVPSLLKPAVLLTKDIKNQKIESFSMGSKWRDGSLKVDIPVQLLSVYFNVNFSIVSQVNPHISLFFYTPKGTVGRPVVMARRTTKKGKYASLRGGFIATALEQLLRLEIVKWLKIIRSLDLLPHILEQDWSNIWLQRFSGSITIRPRFRLFDIFSLLKDPKEEELAELILIGERAIYPAILFIKHRLSIERAIERGKKFTANKKLLTRTDNGLQKTSSQNKEEREEREEREESARLFSNDAHYETDSSFFSQKSASKNNYDDGKINMFHEDFHNKFDADFESSSSEIESN